MTRLPSGLTMPVICLLLCQLLVDKPPNDSLLTERPRRSRSRSGSNAADCLLGRGGAPQRAKRSLVVVISNPSEESVVVGRFGIYTASFKIPESTGLWLKGAGKEKTCPACVDMECVSVNANRCPPKNVYTISIRSNCHARFLHAGCPAPPTTACFCLPSYTL